MDGADDASLQSLNPPPADCPKCHAHAMTPHTEGGVTFERCDSCGGLWFDLAEHRALRATPHPEQIDPHEPQSKDEKAQWAAPKLTCPRCKVQMSRMRDVDQRSLIYDYCGTCNGSFFDAGEFRRYATTSWFGRITKLFGGK